MKRSLIPVLAILFLVALAAMLLSSCDLADGVFLPAQTSHDLADDVVRIHIRANSNGEEDQAVKLAVRDEITAYLDGKLRGCEDKADAVGVLETERENLADIAQTVLYRNGFDYKVHVELKNENFAKMLRAGVSVSAAYQALHHDEIVAAESARAASDAERRITETIRARGERPGENGAQAEAGVTFKKDVSKLTRAERAEIAKRAMLGGKIEF